MLHVSFINTFINFLFAYKNLLFTELEEKHGSDLKSSQEAHLAQV